MANGKWKNRGKIPKGKTANALWRLDGEIEDTIKAGGDVDKIAAGLESGKLKINGNGTNGKNGKNGINGFIDEDGFTTRSWEDYRKEAKKIWDKIPHGESKKAVVEKALGLGRWPDKDGTLIEYELNSTKSNKDGFQRKKKKTRVKNQNQTRINRAENEKFTDITSEQAAKEWKKKNITDWNNGGNPTGKKLIKGTEDYNKYFRRYEHRIKVADPFWKGETGLDYMSGDPENLTWTTKSQWDLKDAGEMKHGKDFIFDVDQYTGDVTYTPRKGFEPHNSKFKNFTGHIDETIKAAKKVKPVVKGAKFVGKAIPVVGAAVSLASFADGANAAIRKPSKKNFQKLGLRTLDVGLEAIDFFTVGLSTPLTLSAQAGLFTAEEYIDGNLKATKDASEAHNPYIHGGSYGAPQKDRNAV